MSEPPASVSAEAVDALAIEAEVERAVAGLDLARLREDYRAQDEFLFLPRFLGAEAVAGLLEDVARLEPGVHRSYIPRHKKGGSVSHFQVAADGPALLALYRSPALRRSLGALVGADLLLCPDDDPHACALYFYTEAGDHIGWHYDTSYYRGARYTVLLGLVQDASSRLLCRLHTRRRDRAPEDRAVETSPGSLVVMNGDRVYHAVSPARAGDRRVMLTLEYVTSREMGRAHRIVSDLKDAFSYFGVRSLWQARRRSPGKDGSIP
jgi:alkylated DNA repair dioxygenase AlkB